MKKTRTQQIAQLKKEAKAHNIQAVICFLLLFAIPFLPIHILGVGIISVFSFASGMALITEAMEKNKEAKEVQRKLEWFGNF
jgi:predicted membrane protein